MPFVLLPPPTLGAWNEEVMVRVQEATVLSEVALRMETMSQEKVK